MAVTSLVAKYVLVDKLKAFLRDNFTHGTYFIDISDDYIEVTAPRELTETEISSVTQRQ